MTVRDLLEGTRIASDRTADAVEQSLRRISLWQRAFIVGILAALTVVSALVVFPSLTGLFFLQRGTQALMQARQPADIDAAIQSLERAVSLRQDDINIYVQLAQAALLQGQADRAVILLEQAYRLQPSSLFIQRELANAYEQSAQLERSRVVWANLGIQPPTMVALGDGYFERREYEQAARWYSRSLLYQPDLADGLAFRQAAIAALTQQANADKLLATFAQKDSNFVATSVAGTARLGGEHLRWLNQHLQGGVTYGTPLSHPYTQPFGTFWWQGAAIGFFQVSESGRYQISINVRHSDPPPVELSVALDNRKVQVISLTRGDTSWETITLPQAYVLEPGIHTIDLTFINNGQVNGLDRDAAVAWIELSRLPEVAGR